MRTFTKTSVLFFALLAAPVLLSAQEYRTIDGINNNKANPLWGSSRALIPVHGTIGFADGFSTPAGPDRPNPRTISNAVFMQNTLANDVRGMSAYTWAWGQFMDHDVVLSDELHTEDFPISVPPYDMFFDPSGKGNVKIPMKRIEYAVGTGTGPGNPRRYMNNITAFIDASVVYGSDYQRADWLRTFKGGRLKISKGNLLPFNTLSGEYDSPIDTKAPAMAMPNPNIEKWFVAGDLRANENPFLLAMHTLFVREHNRLCGQIAEQNLTWTDEQIYQHVRRLVAGIVQAIVYEEWLPALGMTVTPYKGYNEQVDPGILNIFSVAAFRYGHTTINSLLVRMDNKGQYIPEGDILLRDAFFNPWVTLNVGGIEPYLIGMATVVQQDFDCKVIDDLRNFLFGAPGAGGLDLAAININRGRERGLPDYNTVRADFGFPKLKSFNAMSSDPLMNQTLQFVYANKIDNIDPWVGMLAEDHMHGALFGLTAMTIVKKQFMDLRDGDRFYYENDPGLNAEEKSWIKKSKLSEVIRRNSPITIVQKNIFFVEALVSTSENDKGTEQLSIAVYPNPVYEVLTTRIYQTRQADAIFQISDSQGRVIMKDNMRLSPGNNVISIRLPEMTDGLYVASIVSESNVSNAKFVKVNR